MNNPGLAKFLRSVSVFSELSDDRCDELISCSSVERFDRRTVIQRSGDPHHHLYIVMTGRLEMVAHSPWGAEMTIAVFGPGSTSSWVALFLDSPAERTLVATPDTRLLAIPAIQLRAFLERQPALYPKVLTLDGKRFRALLDLTALVLNPVRSQRLATLLLMIADVSGDTSAQPKVLLTHHQLQQLANCSRQVLHRCLRELQQDGLIKQGYGSIQIQDVAALSAYAKQAAVGAANRLS